MGQNLPCNKQCYRERKTKPKKYGRKKRIGSERRFLFLIVATCITLVPVAQDAGSSMMAGIAAEVAGEGWMDHDRKHSCIDNALRHNVNFDERRGYGNVFMF